MATAVLLLAACGDDDDDTSDTSADTDTTAPEDEGGAPQSVIDAANEEGQLILNWGHSTIPEEIDNWVEQFNETYGIEVEVQFTPSPNMPGNLNTIIQENNGNRPASADVFLGTTNHITDGDEAGLFEPLDFLAEWNPDVESQLFADNLGVTLLTQVPGFIYNNEELDEEDLPQTYEEMVELAEEQPVATTPFAAGFNVLGADEFLGVEGALEHGEAFGDAQAGAIGCSDVDRVATGEFVGLWISCAQNIAAIAAEGGAPVSFAFVGESAWTNSWVLGLPKNAANPNVAMLWMDFLLSEDGQAMIYSTEKADNIDLPGSQSKAGVEELAGDRELFKNDYQWQLDHPETADVAFDDEMTALVTNRD